MGATLLETGNLGAVLTFVPFVTKTSSVVAKAMVATLVQFSSTGHEGAIMTTPTRITMAFMFLGITLAMTEAITGTILFTTIFTRVMGMAEASTVVTLSTTVLLVTVIGTRRQIAADARETLVTMAFLCPLITHTITTAIIGTQVNLGLTL